MHITDISLKRPVTVIILVLSLCFFGLLTFKNMGVQRIPDIDFPAVTVTTTMEGATASVMDNDVADVIEEKLSGISGLESMSTSSYEGRTVTVVQFDLDRDVDAAAADVREKVNQAEADLPDEADTPIVSKLAISDSAIVTIAVTGDASYREKVEFIDKVAKPAIESVSGVGNVNTPGMRDREIRIWLNPSILESRGLTVSDVSQAIASKHVELPAGSIENKNNKVELRLKGEYETVESLKRLPIVVNNGAIVRLKDIARVEDAFEDKDSSALYNGEETILISVQKQRGANEVAVADDIVRKVKELENQTPNGISLKVIDNDADFVRSSMKGAMSDIIKAIFICSLIMLFFLRTFGATFVAVITIPVCLLGSLIPMKALGLTINNLTMMGLTLAVGMVVDATIVVLDNIHRHVENGIPPMQASFIGTKEVTFAVLAGAMTTLAVFAPTAFMGGIIGKFFYSFGMAVVCTIALSLVISLTLTPFLCSRLLRKNKPGRISLAIEHFLESLEECYRGLLKGAISHRRLTLFVAACLFVCGLFLASQVGKGFFPSEDNGKFTISVEAPAGTSLEATERIMKEIDRIVRQDSSVAFTYAEIGTGVGKEINKGELHVQLVSRENRPNVKDLMDKFRQKLIVFKNVKLTFATWGSADIEMNLVGSTPEKLVNISQKIIADLQKDGRLTDINTDMRLNKPQLVIEPDRGRTDDMNISIKDLSNEIKAYFGGVKAGVFKEGGHRYDIRLMAEPNVRSNITDINQVTVKNSDGKIVRVPGLVKVKETLGPNVIKRYARQTSITISANVKKGFSSGEGMALIRATANKYLPKDGSVRILAAGRSKHQEEDFRRLFTTLLIAIILVYVVMAVQFESFLHPFTVMFSLPLLTPGAFGLLYMAGNNLDMMSFIGLILLVGTVVNNAIVLVDFINQQRSKGIDKVQAVINAGPLRLRAILMTALSDMAGMLPVALLLSEGSELRQPMAIAIIGGFITATPLTLLVIPTVYLVLDDIKDRAKVLLRWFKRNIRRRGLISTMQVLFGGGKF
jgi:HAE1 family hydrophobic/amphiphilic exporter-1